MFLEDGIMKFSERSMRQLNKTVNTLFNKVNHKIEFFYLQTKNILITEQKADEPELNAISTKIEY